MEEDKGERVSVVCMRERLEIVAVRDTTVERVGSLVACKNQNNLGQVIEVSRKVSLLCKTSTQSYKHHFH